MGIAWNPLVDILRKQFTCATFDNRGIGVSQPAGKPVTVKQMASDTLALMDHLGWTSAHIVGHSLGGLIAMQAGAMAMPRVRSLSLLCTIARGAAALRPSWKLLSILLRVKAGTRSMRRRAFMDLVLPASLAKANLDQTTADHLVAVLGHDLADIPPIAHQQLRAMLRHDITPQLAGLSGLPTFVINGEQDMLAPPSSGRVIAAAIAGSCYVEIAGATHAFPVLEPDRCTAMLLPHLERAEIELGTRTG